MSLIAAAVVTDSSITIRRVPIEFLEIELATLEGMGMKYDLDAGVHVGQRQDAARRPHDDPGAAARADRQDPPDAVPGPQHRQPALLRAHRGRRRGQHDDPRLGLREPRDLPHRADQGRRQGAAARPAPRHRRGPDPLARGRGRLPARAASRPSSCCSRCSPRPARRCCATSTSSTAATRTSPSVSTRSAPPSRSSATSDTGLTALAGLRPVCPRRPLDG